MSAQARPCTSRCQDWMAQLGPQQAQGGVARDRRSRLIHPLFLHKNPPRQDQCLRPLSRGGKAAVYQQLIETNPGGRSHGQRSA